MKKILLIIIPLLAAILVFALFWFFLGRNSGKGALQVTANPKSQVFLNGKLIGQTPLCKCEAADMIAVGEYTIRLVSSEDGVEPFEAKIPIGASVLTVVDRTFGKGATSEGSIITLTPLENKKGTVLLVTSIPEKVDVIVNKTKSGVSPLQLTSLTESDHELKLSKAGYRDKNIRIRVVNGYQVTVVVHLGIDPNVLSASPTQAVTTTPTPDPKASPSMSPKTQQVEILQTPNGFLNVRATPSLSAEIITRINPGEKFEFVSETEGWYEIKLATGQNGWISQQYAQKL